MSIEIGSKWVKNGEMVEVENIKDNHFDNNRTSRIDCVWFWDEQGRIHVLTESDFLQQYKPYEEFVYRWVYVVNNAIVFSAEKMTHDEFKKKYIGGNIELYACVSETKEKRERK